MPNENPTRDSLSLETHERHVLFMLTGDQPLWSPTTSAAPWTTGSPRWTPSAACAVADSPTAPLTASCSRRTRACAPWRSSVAWSEQVASAAPQGGAALSHTSAAVRLGLRCHHRSNRTQLSVQLGIEQVMIDRHQIVHLGQKAAGTSRARIGGHAML
jgi:hypothetical protein